MKDKGQEIAKTQEGYKKGSFACAPLHQLEDISIKIHVLGKWSRTLNSWPIYLIVKVQY